MVASAEPFECGAPAVRRDPVRLLTRVQHRMQCWEGRSDCGDTPITREWCALHTQTIEHRIVIVVQVEEKNPNGLWSGANPEKSMGVQKPPALPDAPLSAPRPLKAPLAPPFMLPAYHRRMLR